MASKSIISSSRCLLGFISFLVLFNPGSFINWKPALILRQQTDNQIILDKAQIAISDCETNGNYSELLSEVARLRQTITNLNFTVELLLNIVKDSHQNGFI